MTQQTDDTDSTDDAQPLTHDWIAVLAEYWRQADWEQFSGQQQAHEDTFGERLIPATRAGDVHGALETLAKGLGIATPDLPTAHVDPLVAHDEAAMRVLRREHVWLTNKASETVDNYFAARDGDNETTPSTTDLSDFITTED